MSNETAKSGQAAIALREVSKYFPDGTAAVEGVSLDVKEGEFVVLVGPSGCGKSTLLRLIAGLESLSDGAILIGGRDVTHIAARDRDVAMVFQDYALYPQMSVRRNLEFPLKTRRVSKASAALRVAEIERVLAIEELTDRRPGELSGGQRQRVAMGRALVREPSAFLMDEPLSNLDAALRVKMRAALSRLHVELGITTVYVTHDQIEAMTLGHRIAVLRNGRLQQYDEPDAIFDRPANAFVANFIGSPGMNLIVAELSDGSAHVGGATVPVPQSLGTLVDSRQVVLGVRPTDVSVRTGSEPEGFVEIGARVEVVENFGSEKMLIVTIAGAGEDARFRLGESSDESVHLDGWDGTNFNVKANRSLTPVVGDRITLTLDPERIYVFDAKTGASIAAPSVPPHHVGVGHCVGNETQPASGLDPAGARPRLPS